jgi:aminodeoxyfutalosine deaminase
MHEPPPIRTFRARWVFPIHSPPIRDGIVAIAGPRIVHVGSDSAGFRPADAGNVAILPGLVNAHTHLEFSDLDAPLGHEGMPITDWIAAVVQHRRRRDIEGAICPTEAIRRGIAESLRHGVTTLGEIATSDWPIDAVSDLPVGGVVFRELLGLSPERVEPLYRSACSYLAFASLDTAWRTGLSPHAPYSVHPDLLARAVDLALRAEVPLVMHLAESREELQLLASHDGPFVPLLEALNAWYPAAIPRGARPMDFLRILAKAPRVLVIHGNYLADDEIEFLGEHAARMSVVYCPRTHRYFQHQRYPLDRMLAAGVRVALGTDSRGSTPDLSLLAELRQVSRDFPEVAPAQILRMATVRAAEALGEASGRGALAAGNPADLVFVALPDREGDPYELLLDTETPILATIRGAEFVAGDMRTPEA